MMSCIDSFVYLNVRKCAPFCKGGVQPKSSKKALFVQKMVAKWQMHHQGNTNARSPPIQSVRKIRFPTESLFSPPEKPRLKIQMGASSRPQFNHSLQADAKNASVAALRSLEKPSPKHGLKGACHPTLQLCM